MNPHLSPPPKCHPTEAPHSSQDPQMSSSDWSSPTVERWRACNRCALCLTRACGDFATIIVSCVLIFIAVGPVSLHGLSQSWDVSLLSSCLQCANLPKIPSQHIPSLMCCELVCDLHPCDKWLEQIGPHDSKHTRAVCNKRSVGVHHQSSVTVEPLISSG